jgi:GNAT superfamily N-acetyltransferase
MGIARLLVHSFGGRAKRRPEERIVLSGTLPDFIPGTLTLRRGSSRDYAALEQFHYIQRRPATWAAVWVIQYHSVRAYRSVEHPVRFDGCPTGASRPVAVGVLSYPVPSCRLRERVLGIERLSRREKLRWINRNVRTISRVIVHPQFRSLGLSSILVRCLCDHCDTRYVEAIAMMARAHPFFERAGMTRIEADDPDEPAYFIFDRAARASTRRAA